MSAAKEPKPVEPDEIPGDAELPPVADALRAVQKAMEDLAVLLGADSAATLDALKHAGRAAADNLAGFAEGARDMGRSAQDLGRSAQDLGRSAQDLGRDKLDDLGAAVRRNPLAWLAAAAGVGLVVGLWRNRGGRS